MVLTKWQPCCQSHSKSDQNSKSGHGRPSENRTCPVFGSPLYIRRIQFSNQISSSFNKAPFPRTLWGTCHCRDTYRSTGRSGRSRLPQNRISPWKTGSIQTSIKNFFEKTLSGKTWPGHQFWFSSPSDWVAKAGLIRCMEPVSRLYWLILRALASLAVDRNIPCILLGFRMKILFTWIHIWFR